MFLSDGEWSCGNFVQIVYLLACFVGPITEVPRNVLDIGKLTMTILSKMLNLGDTELSVLSF